MDRKKSVLLIHKYSHYVHLFQKLLDSSLYHVEAADSAGKAEILYRTNHYDFVIIHFDEKVFKGTLESILSQKPNQAMITISDLPICSSANGCNHCLRDFNKIRLYGNDIRNIGYYLNDFDSITCAYAHGCGENQIYMELLIELDIKENIYFRDFSIKNNRLALIPNELNDGYIFNDEFLKIVCKVSEYDSFTYEIDEDKRIIVRPR